MVVWARQIVHTGQSEQDVWEGYTPIFLRDGLQVLDDNRAGETQHYSMMFEEPQDFTSVMDLVNEGEFGAVEWESETTYSFVGVTEIENVHVSNYVYEGVIIEKEFEPVSVGLGFANVLAKDYYLATFNGKLIVNNRGGNLLTMIANTINANSFVNDNKTFAEFNTGSYDGPPVSQFRNEDSSVIDVETQTIEADSVPTTDTFSFVVEPKFIWP